MHLSPIALAAVALFVILGCIGLGRCLWVFGHFSYAKFSVHNERRLNRNLIDLTEFHRKFAQTYAKKLDDLISYEDNMRLRYGLNTISNDVRKAGIGGAPSVEEVIRAQLTDPHVIRADTIQDLIESLIRQADFESSTFARMNDYIMRQHDYWAQCPSIWPTFGRITSGFGYRVDPIYESGSFFHPGLDIANSVWTPVRATADGIVISTNGKTNYGNMVIIDHRGSGFQTAYAHLVQMTVEENQFVKRGELIGYMGSTGRSTGPHLHYEIRKLNSTMNPMAHILPQDTIID